MRLFTLGKQFVQQFIQTAFHALDARDLWHRFNIQITMVDIVNTLVSPAWSLPGMHPGSY